MAQESTGLSSPEARPGLLGALSGSRAKPWPGRLAPPLAHQLARRLVLSRLEKIEAGRLEVLEGDTRLELGTATGAPDLAGRVVVRDGAFWERLAWGGSIGAAEAYCDGLWTTPDLTAVIRVLARNQGALAEVDAGTARIAGPLRALMHRLRSNTRAGSIRNISAHYDTGSDFFAQFLDPTLTYSCAIFPGDFADLDTAQRWKLDTICRKLELSRDDHLLEIGTGWGSLAIHAATKYGSRVTTTTISQQQYDYASQAVATAGLTDRVTVLREDYRNLPARLGGPARERFDKLVSVEMIEAVGHAYLPRYFEVLSELLAPDGLALVQAILMPDERYEAYRRSVDFIQQYIFPGGHLPSLARIQESTASRTDLRLVDLEDLTPHYAKTLAAWSRRFNDNEEAIAGLGLSATERRKWRYYFSYCEGGFLERAVGTAQLLYAKPGNRRQPEAAGLF